MSDIKRINVNGSGSIINPDYDVKLNHTDASLFTADALKYIAGYNPVNGINMQNAVDVLAKKHSSLESEVSKHPYVKESDYDFSISDTHSYDIVLFYDGHIRTKCFDSSVDATIEHRGLMSKEDKILLDSAIVKLDTIEDGALKNNISISESSDDDFSINDENGYSIVKFQNGHIKTKNFDSSELSPIPEPSDSYKSKMWGKVLVCCGDSITYGADMDAAGIISTPSIEMYHQGGNGTITKVTSNALMTYGYQIAERHNMTFYNCGISGSTMLGMSNKNGFSLENGRYTKLPDEIDYLTIFFGWNDTAYGTLGTIDDATNESYYGGYNVVLPYLQNKYPYTKICLIVPFGTDAGHRGAIRLLANKWGVACFDLYKEGMPLYYGRESNSICLPSVMSANRAKFQANGAHPSYMGHKQIADMLEAVLLSI